MIYFYTDFITKLKDNEVFVFGSNLQGFHGAGSAGYASFNKKGNIWRTENYDKKPNGWKGCWNVKGVGEGFQEGTKGKSYALPTVTRAGMKRSRTIQEISDSVKKLYDFATENPQYNFYLAYMDDGKNLNGYTSSEFFQAFKDKKIPENILFHESVQEHLR